VKKIIANYELFNHYIMQFQIKFTNEST